MVSELAKPENRVHYPMNKEHERSRKDAWTDAPLRHLGGHDGKARVETSPATRPA